MTIEANRTCRETCQKCATACDQCASVNLLDDNKESTRASIQLALECALLCDTTTRILERESKFADAVCLACAELCRECAEECRKHSEQHFHDCADACDACATECEMFAGILV